MVAQSLPAQDRPVMPWSADGTLEIVLIIISAARLFYVCNSTCPDHTVGSDACDGRSLVSVADLFGGPDVLVHAKQVIGVVAALDLSEAAVVCAIRLLHPIVFIVGHEVDVDAAGGEGCGRIEQPASPCDAGRIL